MDCLINECDTFCESGGQECFMEGLINSVVQGMNILLWFKDIVLPFKKSEFIAMKWQFGLFGSKSAGHAKPFQNQFSNPLWLLGSQMEQKSKGHILNFQKSPNLHHPIV